MPPRACHVAHARAQAKKPKGEAPGQTLRLLLVGDVRSGDRTPRSEERGGVSSPQGLDWGQVCQRAAHTGIARPGPNMLTRPTARGAKGLNRSGLRRRIRAMPGHSARRTLSAIPCSVATLSAPRRRRLQVHDELAHVEAVARVLREGGET